MIDRPLDEFRQGGRLAAKPQLAAGDARDIDQIVNQTPELFELLRHHADELEDLIESLGLSGNELDRGGQWGERIAELVGERGEKFVLAAIGIAEALLDPLALGDFGLEGCIELLQLRGSLLDALLKLQVVLADLLFERSFIHNREPCRKGAQRFPAILALGLVQV